MGKCLSSYFCTVYSVGTYINKLTTLKSHYNYRKKTNTIKNVLHFIFPLSNKQSAWLVAQEQCNVLLLWLLASFSYFICYTTS